MKSIIRTLLLSFAFAGLSACATVTLEGDGSKTADSKTGTDTVHGSYYNFVWSAPPAEKCEDGNNLVRIRTHTNVAYSLVSILSLGLYVPQTVTWWCDGAQQDDPDEEPWVPPENQ